MQTPTWAAFKKTQGWAEYHAEGLFVLGKRMPFGQFFLYAPEVPFSAVGLSALATELRDLARQQGAFVIRLDFLDEWSAQAVSALKEVGFIKAFEDVQPEFRQWIDLRPEPQAMLAGMKQKGRYNIKVAERLGVVVEHARDTQQFVDLYKETAKRDGFSGRSAQYFTRLVGALEANGPTHVWAARYKQQTLAAAITHSFGGMTSYLYGASSSTNREVMAPYALHWAIIQEAKDRGDMTYDLLAIAPFAHDGYTLTEADYRLAQKYAGITRFKQQFGGRGIHLLGSWDLVINSLVYQTFKTAQRVRRA